VLEAAAQRFDDRVVILGIDQGESPAVVAEFVEQMRITFPIPLDLNQDVGDQYNVRAMPTTFFVDADGVIRHIWVGEMNAIVLAEGIATIWP